MTFSDIAPLPEEYINQEFIETQQQYEEMLQYLGTHQVLQLDSETCGRDQIALFLDQQEYEAQLDNVIMTSGGIEQIEADQEALAAAKELLKDYETYLKQSVLAADQKLVLTNLSPLHRSELTLRRKKLTETEKKLGHVKDYIKLVRKINALQKKIEADKSGLIFHRCILALVQVGTVFGAEQKQFLIEPNLLDERFNTLLRSRKAIIGMNLKFDMSVLNFHKGLRFDDVDTVCYDIMLADKGLNSGKVRSFKLKDIAERWLGYAQDKEEQLSYWLARPLRPEQLKYAALDVITPGLIFKVLKKEIQATGDHLVEWTKLQMEFLKVLTKMELTGLHVNLEKTQALIDEMNPIIEQARKHIADGFYTDASNEDSFVPGLGDTVVWDEAEQKFTLKDTKDLASPKETLAKLQAYGKKYDIPALIYLTGTGKDTFEEIEDNIPLINKITDFRSLIKTQKDFCGAILDFHVDSRIHSNFTQIQKEGTRMSSKQPNVQNISHAGKIKKGQTYEEAFLDWKPSEKLRTLFDEPPGYKMYDCDYSQIELYMIAYYSQDEAMMRAIRDGVDLHIQTANTLFDLGWSYEDLKDKAKIKEFKELYDRERQIAKTFNFAAVYGAGAKKLIKQLYKAGIYDMTEQMVNELKKAWYAMYPGIKAWQDATLSRAQHFHDCFTRMGRAIYFDPYGNVYSKAFNTPIQASCYEGLQRAAVIFNGKVMDLERRGIIKDGDIQLVNLVHDEFIVYAKSKINEESVKRLIESSMLEGMQPLMEDEYSTKGELVYQKVAPQAECSRVLRWSDK